MAKPPKAPIGVAIIARNAAASIGACLDSLRPHVQQLVVGVDETTSDRTGKVAQQHGASVYPIQVSDWHECPQHGRVLAQDFAKARNASFRHLDPDLEFWLWVDADDVLERGDLLPALCQATPADSAGVWFPYVYARTEVVDGSYQPNTLFHRERLLRTVVNGQPVTWTWRYRVHEVVTPDCPAHWIKADDVRVVHQSGQHKSDDSAPRNIRLLEIELEEKPGDARTLFYLGNSYFALSQWQEAVTWYERLIEVGTNPYELWQAYLYLGKAYQRLGDVNNALKAAFGALEVVPDHPEPYYALAEVYGMAADWQRVIYWTKQGRTKREPPFFVFKNPMDYAYNHHLPMADALAQLGYVPAARQELESAHQVYPVPKVDEAIQRYRDLEAAADQATAYARLAAPLGDAGKIDLWERLDLPPIARQFGRARDLVMPAYLRQRPATQPRIAFYCGRALEEWCPGSLNGTGIGGSETAVVQIARQFQQDGWRVDVFNGAGRYEGLYDGVGYWDPERYRREAVDVLVAWRLPAADLSGADRERAGRVSLLWCHDLHYGPEATGDFGKWDRVLGVSAWHAQMLQRYYGLGERVDWLPNGVDLGRFDPSLKKVPFRCIYASSPDRGLLRLLRLWPQIVAGEPAAELVLAYGWENTDQAIARGDQLAAQIKGEIEALLPKTAQVTWRGRLPQDELARLYGEAVLWLYPTDFLEVSCISAMEALAAGAVPVTSTFGALPETIGLAGALVPGNVYGAAWAEFYCHIARGLLTDPTLRQPLALAGRERARQFTWAAAYRRWRDLVEGLLARPKLLAGVA